MSSFSDVPALHAGGNAASDAARLQAELQDLQRERRQVPRRARTRAGAQARRRRAVPGASTRDHCGMGRCLQCVCLWRRARQGAGAPPTLCARRVTTSACVRACMRACSRACRAQAELKLRDLDTRRGPGGRGGGVIGPGGRGAGLRGAPDRDARDAGVFDRDGQRANGEGRDGRLQGRFGAGGDLRGELRRASDMRGGDLRDLRAPGHRIPWDAGDARGGAAERPKAPHPWDPKPKATVQRDAKPARAVIQSAITKRGREEEEEAGEVPADDDDVLRRKRGRGDDDDEEEEDAETGKGDGDEAQPPSGMRMDRPDAFDRAAKSRRISADEKDWDRARDRDGRRDGGRERERERDAGRERQLRSPREKRSSGQDAGSKATVINKAEVKNRNKRMFGGLLGHLQKAKKEEEVISQSEIIKKRQELQEAVEQKDVEMSQKMREESRAELQAAREKAREV